MHDWGFNLQKILVFVSLSPVSVALKGEKLSSVLQIGKQQKAEG